MNIDNQVNQIVQKIVSDLTVKINQQITDAVERKIAEIISMDTNTMLSTLLSKKLDARVGQLPIDTNTIQTQLQKRVDSIAESLSATIQSSAINKINETVNAQINRIRFCTKCSGCIKLSD